jgi:catechol 2,3-dioxygenase-like lactoylglutathione lyase family enzyme
MIGMLRNVAFDAPDHRALAQFYAELLGGDILGDSDEWAVLSTADGWRIGCQPAAGYLPPAWPSQVRPQQLHLDFQVADIGAAGKRAESLGAVRAVAADAAESDAAGEKLLVLTDPAGHPFCLCANEQSEPIRVFGVCIDCPDPVALARFYAPLLGMESKYAGVDGAWLSGSGTAGSGSGAITANVTFQYVADYNAPRWPDPAFPQQAHLDVMVSDVHAAEGQVLELGGHRLPGAGDNWRVYADPAGHPFCLVFDPE